MKSIFVGSVLLLLIHAGKGQKSEVHKIPCADNISICKDAGFPDSRCFGGFCMCQNATGQIEYCLGSPKSLIEPPRISLVGRICKHETDCPMENGFCNSTNSQCGCKSGYVASTDTHKCLLIANEMGASCEDDRQCLVNMANTTCSEKQCVCEKGYHHFDKKCWKSIGVGESCSSSNECLHISDAECNQNNNTCECPSHRIFSANEKKCLLLAHGILDDCKESIQCSNPFGDSECVDERCKCIENYHFEDSLSRCVVSRGINERCDHDHECFQNDVINGERNLKCVGNICSCTGIFQMIDNKCVIDSGASSISVFFAGLLISSFTIFMLK